MAYKELKSHPLDYVILIGGAGALTVGLFAAWPNSLLQSVFAVAIGAFYTLWGAFHHLRLKNLTATVLLEYALMGVFVTSLIWYTINF